MFLERVGDGEGRTEQGLERCVGFGEGGMMRLAACLAVLGSDLDSASEASYYEEPTQGALDQIDALLAEAQAALSQSGIDLDATSVDDLSRLLQREVQQRLDMSGIKDRLTDAGQAAAFSNATRQTPRLLTLYAMYYRHRWEGTERATGRKITPLPAHVQVCSTSDMIHLNRFM